MPSAVLRAGLLGEAYGTELEVVEAADGLEALDVLRSRPDIDLLLAERIADAFLKQHRYDPRTDPIAFDRLRLAAESLKRALSSGEKVAKAQRDGGSVNPLVKIQAAIGHKLALSKVKNALGPNDPIPIAANGPTSARHVASWSDIALSVVYVPSVLLKPVWITKSNYTLLFKEGFLKKGEVCRGTFKKFC